MLQEMDVKTIREERTLVPGGDIRQRGNRWLRDAFKKSSAKRVPRETEFRRIIKMIEGKHEFCALVNLIIDFIVCLMFQWYDCIPKISGDFTGPN